MWDIHSGKNLSRKGLFLLRISEVQGETSTSRMILETEIRAPSSLVRLQT